MGGETTCVWCRAGRGRVWGAERGGGVGGGVWVGVWWGGGWVVSVGGGGGGGGQCLTKDREALSFNVYCRVGGQEQSQDSYSSTFATPGAG